MTEKISWVTVLVIKASYRCHYQVGKAPPVLYEEQVTPLLAKGWSFHGETYGATCFCLDASPLVPLSCIGMPYLQTEHCTPYPVAKFESLFFHNTLLLQRDSLLKGAFKWPKFSLTISAHCYYTETLHEFNILASFLKRIWVQLSKSFSELKIVWFLWHLDQKIVFIL